MVAAGGGGDGGGAHNCNATLPTLTGAQPHIGRIDSPAQLVCREILKRRWEDSPK